MRDIRSWLRLGRAPRRRSPEPLFPRRRPEVEPLERRWLLATYTTYTLPIADSEPDGITGGPDGNVWFTIARPIGQIGTITPAGVVSKVNLPNTSQEEPVDITVGPGAAKTLWFSDNMVHPPLTDWPIIGKITTAGAVTEYTPWGTNTARGLEGITLGPDGNLWVAENSANYVAVVSTSGSLLHEYTVTSPWDLVTGPDGNVWVTEEGNNKIAKLTTGGSLTEYTIPTSNSQPEGITVGSDGNLWFCEYNSGNVGRITTSGTITEYSTGSGSDQPENITDGPDGNLYITLSNAGEVEMMTTAGTDLATYAVASDPTDITTGPDGNLWMTHYYAYLIGKLTPDIEAVQRVDLTETNIGLQDSSIVADGRIGLRPNDDLRILQPLDLGLSRPSALDDSFGGDGGEALFGLEPQPGNSYSGILDPALVYASSAVNTHPIGEIDYPSIASLGVPTLLKLQVTWNNGTPQPWITFSTAGHAPGDIYALAAQITTAVTQPGAYPWLFHLQATYGNTTYDRYASGLALVGVDLNSAFGPGWSLTGLDSLVIQNNGVEMLFGNGAPARWFARNVDGSYQSPLDDPGTLVKNGSGYTYTSKHQVTWNFTSTGLLSSMVDQHGLAITFTYSGSQLSTIQMPDGGVTTFSYSSNLLAAIVEPGGRTLTFTHNSSTGDLTGIIDSDASLRTFSYNSNHQLLTEQWTPLNVTYTYRSFAATEELNRTALSLPGIKELVPPARVDHATRKEQRRAVLYRQACRENQRGSPLFRPGDPARPSADGWPRLLFDLAVLQEDRPQFALAA